MEGEMRLIKRHHLTQLSYFRNDRLLIVFSRRRRHTDYLTRLVKQFSNIAANCLYLKITPAQTQREMQRASAVVSFGLL